MDRDTIIHSDGNAELGKIRDEVEAQNGATIINPADGQLIQKPNVIPVTMKRNVTKFGVRDRSKVGTTFLVRLDTIREKRLDMKDGTERVVTIINTVDVNGKDLGWTFAEYFFLD